MSDTPHIGQRIRVGQRIGVIVDIVGEIDTLDDGAYDIARYIVVSDDGVWDAYLDELISLNAPGPTRCKLSRLRASAPERDSQLTFF